MEARRLSPHRLVPDEDDFLSRYVNLEWDAEGSEWNDYRDEFPDILSSEFIFSREHSYEKFYEGVKNSRKSSLDKPVGLLMQVKPRALIVCESFKSSSWGKFLKSERKHRDSGQGYFKENTACCNSKANIEKTEDKNNGRRSKCHSVASACKRSKSVNDVLEDSPEEIEPKQQQKQSVKKERRQEKAREAANRFSKQFSVYSQSFELNTRFLSKSHHHITHWKPENSRVKTRLEHPTNKKAAILDVAVEKRMNCKKGDNEKVTEVEAIRRKFYTDKYYRSWVWGPEDSPSSKPKLFGKTNQKAQNSSTKSSKMHCSTECASRRTRFQRISKERNKIPRPFRQLSESDTALSSTVSLPAISSILSACPQKTPHKLGHFPCISTDNLMKQYRKCHDEIVKQKHKNK